MWIRVWISVCLALVAVLCCFERCSAELQFGYEEDTRIGPCDFIIVGGGTGGLALADRLAEVQHWKVCVLERGPKEKRMNGWYTNSYKFTSPHDPFWLTQPQLATLETQSSGYLKNVNRDGRMIYVPRFRGRGGTSRVYGAIVRRASPGVLDLWPEGWKNADLTPYYKKSEDHYCYYDSENVTGITKEECERWHGKDGPMQINSQLEEAFQKFPVDMKYLCEDTTMAWKGYVHDYNGPLEDRIGCSVFQQFKLRTNDDYKPTPEARSNRASTTARGSSYTGYYKYSKNKPVLLTSAPVTKILFDEDKKAVGVIYLNEETKKTKTLRALKEVIVAAGALDTPPLLQVSGVGPSKLLKDIGVDVVAENPHVGQHLWDHISVPFVLKLNHRADDLCCHSKGSDVPHVVIDGTVYETKDLAGINGPFSWIIHLRSNVTRIPADMADIQLYVMGNSKLFDEMAPLCTGGNNNGGDDSKSCNGRCTLEGTIRIIDQWPEFRGHINAVTSSVFDKAELQYGWNYTVDGEASDHFKKVAKLFRDQIRSLRHMFFGEAADPKIRKLVRGEVAPGSHIVTDNDLDAWMRDMFVSALHPACSCRMPDCVDEFLQVKGVSGLRVCDASAFATQVDGNPVATIFAMAEKLADTIKGVHLMHVNVAVRRDLLLTAEQGKLDSNILDKLAEHVVKEATQCIEAKLSYDWISTGKGTAAILVRFSLVCGIFLDQRLVADTVANLILTTLPMEGCTRNEYPHFHREEATRPNTGENPGSATTPYVFVVWCQYYEQASSMTVWDDVDTLRDKTPGAIICFKLNCQPKKCYTLTHYSAEDHEIIYIEDDTGMNCVDYIAIKKVTNRTSPSASYMRTASMVAIPGIDWYADLVQDVFENIYVPSGRRLARGYPPLNTHDGWWMETSDGMLIYESNDVQNGYEIASFDMDGTIIKTKSGEVFPVDENDWVFTSTSVPAKFKSNEDKGIKNVVMSNQLGISIGAQDKGEWMTKVEDITKALGVPIRVMAAILKNRNRKPQTGMWDYFSCTLNQFKTIDKSKSVYVGDSAGRPGDHSDSDRVFAKNVGVKFKRPGRYFKTVGTDCN